MRLNSLFAIAYLLFWENLDTSTKNYKSDADTLYRRQYIKQNATICSHTLLHSTES